jgi:hypothetical protein
MFVGNKLVKKTVKTKFKKNQDFDNNNAKSKEKSKHHDRSFYRLLKQEKEDYEL